MCSVAKRNPLFLFRLIALLNEAASGRKTKDQERSYLYSRHISVMNNRSISHEHFRATTL